MLSVPCAILLADPATGTRRALAVLALLAFAASAAAAPLHAAGLGMGQPAGLPAAARAAGALGDRDGAAAARRPRWRWPSRWRLAAGATALVPAPDRAPPGDRLRAARGPLLSEPLECAGRRYWIAPEPDHYVIEGEDGSRRPGDAARCRDGRLVALRAGEAGSRPPARVSPDGRWVLVEAWARGSWDVRAMEPATRTDGRGRRHSRQRDRAVLVRRRRPRVARLRLAPRALRRRASIPCPSRPDPPFLRTR